jgi:hypothetical protein
MDFSQAEAARQAAEQAATTAAEYGSKSYTIADELRKAMGERYAESPFPQQTAQARSDYMSAADAQRAKNAEMVAGGTILSPSQQQAIMSSARNAALVPLTSANLIEKGVFGTMEDLINAGTNAFKGQTSYMTDLANIKQTAYTNVLNELIKRAEIEEANRRMAVLEAEERRAAEMQPYKIQELQASINKIKSSGGGGSEKWTLGDDQLNAVAQGYLSGTVDISGFGDKERAAIITRARQLSDEQAKVDALNAQKQKENSLWNQITGLITRQATPKAPTYTPPSKVFSGVNLSSLLK